VVLCGSIVPSHVLEQTGQMGRVGQQMKSVASYRKRNDAKRNWQSADWFWGRYIYPMSHGLELFGGCLCEGQENVSTCIFKGGGYT
jgi:hypothetical protein